MGSAVHLPTFFLAGVPKSGTTSLYFYLAQHPQVFMTRIKEPGFFSAADLLGEPYRDMVLGYLQEHGVAIRAYVDGPQAPGIHHLILDWGDYQKLFRDVRDETAVGEATVDYFWYPSAARGIRDRVPDARLLFILRNPADLVLTRYLQQLWNDSRTSFRAWFLQAQTSQYAWIPPLGPQRLATNLQRYLDLFPRHQVHCCLYEDFQADPAAVVKEVFRFLGVDPSYPIDVSRRHNPTVIPRFPRLHDLRRATVGTGPGRRWIPEPVRRAMRRFYRRPRAGLVLDLADRDLVVDYYRDEIARVADLIGRDLSAWLR